MTKVGFIIFSTPARSNDFLARSNDLCSLTKKVEYSRDKLTEYILSLARINQESLKNTSVIFHPENVSLSCSSEFSTYSYKDTDDIDMKIFSNKINVIFTTYDKDIIVPSVVPVIIQTIDAMKNIDNKIYIPFSPNLGPDNADSEEFNSQVIQKGLNNPQSYAIKHPMHETPFIFLGNINSNQRVRSFLLESSSLISTHNTKSILKTNLIIKPLCNWTSSQQLCEDWNKMSQGSYTWKTTEFGSIIFSASETPDYYVIINKPPEGSKAYIDYVPEKTIVYRMEPYIESNSFFNDWIGGLKDKFMYFLEHEHFRNNTEWWLGKTVKQLNAETIVKSRENIISTVISSQYFMPGHKLRIDFIKYFQQNSQLTLDVYGHDNTLNFNNYKGCLPVRQKDDGLIPYKYTIAAENSDIANYFTEKIFDAILAECLCFYWGSRNIEEFIDSRAFIKLPLENKQKSLEIVEEAIINNSWAKRLPYIREAKHRITNYFGWYSRTHSLLAMKNYITFVTSYDIDIPGITLEKRNKDININSDVLGAALRNYSSNIITGTEIVFMMRHLSLWKECYLSNKLMCIIHGKPLPNFCDHISTMISYLSTSKGHIFDNSNDRERTWDLASFSRPAKDLNEWGMFKELFMHSQGTMQLLSYGYILHPRGAKKLIDAFDKYGFITPVNSTFLLLADKHLPGINPLNILLWEKSLVIPQDVDTEQKLTETSLLSNEQKLDLPKSKEDLFHIFRKQKDGNLANTPRGIPKDMGILNSELAIIIMPDAAVKKQLENNK